MKKKGCHSHSSKSYKRDGKQTWQFQPFLITVNQAAQQNQLPDTYLREPKCSLSWSSVLYWRARLCFATVGTLVSHSSLTSFGTRGSSCMGKLLSGSLVKVPVCDMVTSQSEGSPAQQKPTFSVSDSKIKDKCRWSSQLLPKVWEGTELWGFGVLDLTLSVPGVCSHDLMQTRAMP